ncbi:hypothetical protein RRG08_065603 [Elysia crispata]|uniref:Uncharacterized protein n=1 Tax=Elysia crispata TaxID=231223 RepID=A0AAE0YNW4_9GAST|nr:hypothetical protein RRG08_065603 [Elysia crispata]
MASIPTRCAVWIDNHGVAFHKVRAVWIDNHGVNSYKVRAVWIDKHGVAFQLDARGVDRQSWGRQPQECWPCQLADTVIASNTTILESLSFSATASICMLALSSCEQRRGYFISEWQGHGV